MSEHGQTAQDTNSPNHGNDNRGKAFRRVVFIGVLLVVVVVFAALILVAVYHPYLNERVKFGTEMGLGLAVLIAVVAQIIVSRWQWQVMRDTLTQARETSERDQ